MAWEKAALMTCSEDILMNCNICFSGIFFSDYCLKLNFWELIGRGVVMENYRGAATWLKLDVLSCLTATQHMYGHDTVAVKDLKPYISGLKLYLRALTSKVSLFGGLHSLRSLPSQTLASKLDSWACFVFFVKLEEEGSPLWCKEAKSELRSTIYFRNLSHLRYKVWILTFICLDPSLYTFLVVLSSVLRDLWSWATLGPTKWLKWLMYLWVGRKVCFHALSWGHKCILAHLDARFLVWVIMRLRNGKSYKLYPLRTLGASYMSFWALEMNS